jgi:hypothetical protein|tara:strand:+ start:1739 stop:2407 length:669 start_codon:yes stop_codon:yes gene_type:complete
MADQITKILIRSGTNAERNTITLDTAELGYTTDSRRVFVGSNGTYNNGGDVVGNKFAGIYDFTNSTNLTSLTHSLSGDLAWDTNTTTLKVLSGSNGEVANNWGVIGNYSLGTVTRITAGSGLIFNTSDTFITEDGTLNIQLQDGATTTTGSQPRILKKDTNGLYADWNTIYPVNSVVWLTTNTNPTDAGEVLEGSGQTWEAAGTVATAGTGATTLYAWKRTG